VTAETKDHVPTKRSRFLTPRRLIFAILFLILGTVVGFRAHELLSIPDIDEPFDVDAFMSSKVPNEQNAAIHFGKAAALLVPSHKVLDALSNIHPQRFLESENTAEQGWEHAIPEVRVWVVVNRLALREIQRGADCEDCLQCPLSTAATGGFLLVDWRPLRECARLECLEGARLTAGDQGAEAWTCYRNLLRMGRLLSKHTDLIGSMSASAIGELGVSGGAFWAGQKQVRVPELRRAIRNVLSIEGMKTPNSDTIKLQYVKIRELAANGVFDGSALRPWVRYTGYPVQLMRSARLVVANLLTQADRPRYLRTPVHPGRLGLFELDPMNPPDPSLRPAKEVERSARSSASTVAKALEHFAPEAAAEIEAHDPEVFMGSLWGAYLTQDRFQTQRSGLLLALALQLYHREHAEFPESLDELITNGYLKAIPIDPFGKGEPFRYRREPGARGAAVVWSVWLDGIDQGGMDIQGTDLGIRVVPPGVSAAPRK
jgi:hypothetical protein